MGQKILWFDQVKECYTFKRDPSDPLERYVMITDNHVNCYVETYKVDSPNGDHLDISYSWYNYHDTFFRDNIREATMNCYDCKYAQLIKLGIPQEEYNAAYEEAEEQDILDYLERYGCILRPSFNEFCDMIFHSSHDCSYCPYVNTKDCFTAYKQNMIEQIEELLLP